jgi:short-subunit dehydrogenase
MKRIVIVGASSGIGKELALRYAGMGNLVGITGRRTALLQEIQSAYSDRIFTASFDVRTPNAQTNLSALITALGGMDLLVYNAGFGDASKDFNAETERLTAETNVTGGVSLVSEAFAYFLQRGGGQIAITSSVAALRGNSWAPAYSASKAFLSNYAEGLNMKAYRLKKEIVITDIRPGFVATKPAGDNKRFWVASPQKAAAQIVQAIEQKKRVAYVTRRWWLIGQVLKAIPFTLYRRLG